MASCTLHTMEPESNQDTIELEVPVRRAMTFRLDTDTWVRFRTILLRDRTSMQKVFEDYVKRYIEAKEKK
jgi:hypothetical protein